MTPGRCSRCSYRGDLAVHAEETGHEVCCLCRRSLSSEDRQTCTMCVGRVRADLADIEALYDLLPGELLRYAGGTIGVSAGGGGEDSTRLPGGDVLVLLGPGSSGRTQVLGVLTPGGRDDSHGLDELTGDPRSVAYELARYEDDWRIVRGDRAALTSGTVGECRAWLNDRLTWAGRHYPEFATFAEDMTWLRSRLARVTSMDNSPEVGVPCFECETPLRRSYEDRRVVGSCRGHDGVCAVPRTPGCCDLGGLEDEWVCPSCRRRYTLGEYYYAVAARMAETQPDSDALLTVTAIRRRVDVGDGKLRVWHARGKLDTHGRDACGRNLYRWGDVRELLRAAS